MNLNFYLKSMLLAAFVTTHCSAMILPAVVPAGADNTLTTVTLNAATAPVFDEAPAIQFLTETDTERSHIYNESDHHEDATQYKDTTTKLNNLITTKNLAHTLAGTETIEAIIGAVFGEKITHLAAGTEAEYNLKYKLSNVKLKEGDYRSNHFKALNLINEIADLLVTDLIFSDGFTAAAIITPTAGELAGKLDAIAALNRTIDRDMFVKCFNAALTKHAEGIAKVKQFLIIKESAALFKVADGAAIDPFTAAVVETPVAQAFFAGSAQGVSNGDDSPVARELIVSGVVSATVLTAPSIVVPTAPSAALIATTPSTESSETGVSAPVTSVLKVIHSVAAVISEPVSTTITDVVPVNTSVKTSAATTDLSSFSIKGLKALIVKLNADFKNAFKKNRPPIKVELDAAKLELRSRTDTSAKVVPTGGGKKRNKIANNHP
ncbi:MAG: hypothetical protein V4482_01335 [Pseudomonadota bacterium]